MFDCYWKSRSYQGLTIMVIYSSRIAIKFDASCTQIGNLKRKAYEIVNSNWELLIPDLTKKIKGVMHLNRLSSTRIVQYMRACNMQIGGDMIKDQTLRAAKKKLWWLPCKFWLAYKM